MKTFSRIAPIVLLLSLSTNWHVALAGGNWLVGMPLRTQERNLWCWDAVSQMIVQYYGSLYVTQCEIAETVRQKVTYFGTTNCCLNPDVGCNQGYYIDLKSYGVGATVQNGNLSFAQVQAEIDAGHPIGADWPAHSTVVLGYSTPPEWPTNALAINDPWPYYGAQIFDYVQYTSPPYWTKDTVKTTGRIANQAVVYKDDNYGSSSYTVTTGTSTLPYLPPINNQVSSMKVQGFPYIMYDNNNYGGTAWGVTPRDYSTYTKWYGTNDAISSARPVPGSSYSSSPTMIVLFENTNFQGASRIVTSNNDDLTPTGWNDRASSIVVLNGLAQVFQYPNEGGAAYAVTSDGGPNYDGFYPNPSTWGGPDNDISSVHLYTDDMDVYSTTSPIVLYQGQNFTGRALLIKWVAPINGDAPIAWASNLAYQGMDNNVNSIRTYAGWWVIYDQSGSGLELSPNGYYKNPGEIGLTGISSLVFGGSGWQFF